MSELRDVLIIGGGVGGLVSASVLSQLGLKVTLVEKSQALGGDCLHHGCIPSKSLIHAANALHQLQNAEKFTQSKMEAVVDFDKVKAHIQNVIDKIQVHDDPKRFESYGVEVIFGLCHFIDKRRVKLNDRIFAAKRYIIASGSRPFLPTIPGLEKIKFYTNETIFNIPSLPQRLIVLGAGVIGMELAQAFSRLGSQVSIIEASDRVLPAIDSQAGNLLRDIVSEQGLGIYLNTQVIAVDTQKQSLNLECKNEKEGDFSLQGDALLVATGRTPNIEALGLDAAGVVYDKFGILTDRRLRTTNKRIFALGDVTKGKHKFTHMAEYHASIAIAQIAFRFPKRVDQRVVPAVVFTNPEIAMVGLTEQQAKEQGIEHQVHRFEFADIDRSITQLDTQGFIKILVSKGRCIGATIIGPSAGELIAEYALAMQTKMKLSNISQTIHAYPTLSQINRRCANQYFSKALFNPRVKRLVKWLNHLP